VKDVAAIRLFVTGSQRPLPFIASGGPGGE
jgi:hypothetical protein